MAAYDLEEQEQLASIKAWWNTYGNQTTWIALVIALAALGWVGYNKYQEKNAVEAAGAFTKLQNAASSGDVRMVKESSGYIAEKYGSTAYADLAALQAAQTLAEKGDAKSAQLKLEWASEHANDTYLRDVARLRLAALLIDAKDYAGAQKWLAAKPLEPFHIRFAEMRGDLALAQGKKNDAKAAYKEAYDLISKDKSAPDYKVLLGLKLESVGGTQ